MKSGRTVVITGAAGGMGVEFVKRFLGNDDTVIATDISQAALASLSRQVGSDRLHVIVADISRDEDCDAVAGLAREVAGRVDVLVNGAGYFPVQSFEEMTSADWRRVIDVNLTGTALMIKAMLPLMKGRGWAKIVNVGSSSVYGGSKGLSHYVAAKAGVIGLSRSLAREYGDEGITVNIVAPGVTITPAVADLLPKAFQEAQIARRSLQREEHAEDLVGATFFLASPDSDFITGQTIVVDGGLYMI